MVPLQPPSTLEQMTKYLVVSNALPGPTMLSHQPGLPPSWLIPAACASPENAWQQEDRVGSSGVQFPIRFIGDIDRREDHAAIERQGIETNDLGLDDHSDVISYCASRAEASSSFSRKARNAPVTFFACSFASCQRCARQPREFRVVFSDCSRCKFRAP